MHFEGTSREAVWIHGITAAGIPVMGHVGVTKQKITSAPGRINLPDGTPLRPRQIIADSVEMANGADGSLILECLPDRLDGSSPRTLRHPDHWDRLGVDCDGQALVTQDMLGLYKEMAPRFLKITPTCRRSPWTP